MDFFRLNRETFLPDTQPIGGYTSLIWTERYRDASEFELRTPKILETLTLLPEMSMVSIRDSREVMYVETHEIQRAADGTQELVVKGRSAQAFLENRALEGPVSNKKYRMNIMFTHAETAALLIWNAIVNNTTRDVTQQPIRDNTREILDHIPNVVVTDSTTVVQAKKRRWLTGGQVYPQMMEVLELGKLGLRTLRPPTGPARVVRWDDEGKTGVVTSVSNTVNLLRFDIYNGTDRRAGTQNAVVFSTARGDLKDDSYLKSVAALKTMILMVPGRYDARRYYRDRASDKLLSGWDRRVQWADGGEPDLEEIPDRPDNPTAAELDAWQKKRDAIRARNATTTAEFREDLLDKANVELEKHDRIVLLDAKVSENSQKSYGVDYFLGDLVTLAGDYNFKEHMRVVEYIRAFNGTTEVGYPGLAAVNNAPQ